MRRIGTMLVLGIDYADDPEPWMNLLRLLKQEVTPQLP
jgi:hypothetical protein